MDLEAFELVLLRTPEDAPGYDDAELDRIQEEHLAHHARLRATGQVVTNGPAGDRIVLPSCDHNRATRRAAEQSFNSAACSGGRSRRA